MFVGGYKRASDLHARNYRDKLLDKNECTMLQDVHMIRAVRMCVGYVGIR